MFPEDFYLDKSIEVEQTQTTRLPHWHQGEKIQFVTIRLGDSLPQERLDELKKLKTTLSKDRLNSADAKTRELLRAINRWLDAGYGSCILGDKNVRRIVIDALRHYDGDKYLLLGYVVMPNHVHILLVPLSENRLGSIVRQFKSYTAKQINVLSGNSGRLWQREYYDTLIRNRAHLLYCIQYIELNPVHLPVGSYALYIHPDLKR